MKLRKIDIENFGKFHNVHIDLSEGMNLVYGENEAGKSTLHTFIKSILFGMERGRGRASSKDTYSKYEPWINPNHYAGEIEFEAGGKYYSLHRNFDKYSKSIELNCLTDHENIPVEISENINLFQGMTEKIFENTCYIGQLRVIGKENLAAELRDYAANFCATGNQDIHLSHALDYLTNEVKDLEKKEKAILLQREEKKEHLAYEASFLRKEVSILEEKIEEEEEEKLEIGFSMIPIVCGVLMMISFFFLPHIWNFAMAGIGFFFIVFSLLEMNKKKDLEEKEKWKIQHIREEWSEKNTQYQNLLEQIQEAEEDTEKLQEIRWKKNAIFLARERMKSISKETDGGIAKQLNQAASYYLQELTEGSYSKLTITENLEPCLWKNGKRISLGQASRGSLEQVYLALRLAIGEMISGKDYPIILDDTFVFYDDKRCQKALQMLSNLGRQVIIFTCHKREEENLKMLGIPFQKIEL